MANRTTFRERLATYNFEATEQGATIENNWRLIKSEPISTKHADCATSNEGATILVDTDRLMSNYAAGFRYEMPNGLAFECDMKLTPNATHEDGTPTGFKTYYYGTMYRDGKASKAEWLDSTQIKNRLFGSQGWASQKGPKVGAIPTSRKEVLDFSAEWSKELLGHLEAVERILATYGDGYTFAKALDFTLAKRVLKFKARKHAEALYAEYAAQEAEKREARAVKSTKRTKVEDLTTEADFLKALKAQGLSLEALIAAAAAQ